MAPTTYEVILLRDELKETRRELVQERQFNELGSKSFEDICGKIRIISEAILGIEESLTKHNVITMLEMQEEDKTRFSMNKINVSTAIRLAQYYRAEKNELSSLMHIKNINYDKEQIKNYIGDLQNLYRRLNYLINRSNMNTTIDLDILKYDYLRR